MTIVDSFQEKRRLKRESDQFSDNIFWTFQLLLNTFPGKHPFMTKLF